MRGRESGGMSGALWCAALLALFASLAAPACLPAAGAEEAREGWQGEFEEVCSRTLDAMSLSEEELQGLIARCDALMPIIERLDETRKKVYGKRLRMCRDLYAFTLEAKAEKEEKRRGGVKSPSP